MRAMPTLADALRLLNEHARPAELDGMARFGMDVERRLGVSVPKLRRIGKQLGRDHALALALWDTGIPDAQILAGTATRVLRFTGRVITGPPTSLEVIPGSYLGPVIRVRTSVSKSEPARRASTCARSPAPRFEYS